VVHGGPRLRDAVLIDDSVLAAIEDATELAPLHNGPALEAIRAARLLFGDAMPMVAVFDTAFYADLPDVAREYALPQELRHRLQIRRYGFHGLAHRYMIERYRALRPNVPEPRLITLQLGNGCSATASRDGRPLDTSMGYTPAEGLIMGTRSGDIDPLLPLLMMERAGMTAEGVEVVLNKEAGLLGLSGISNDMRDLLAAGDARADLAVRAFCYRVTKYIGAYMAVLRGADAVVFGGGIGEHSPEVREAVCEPLAWCGVALDGALNRRQQDDDWFVSSAGSSVEVLVSHVDEASVMARDAVRALEKAG
jgi:acetate kinase